MASHWYLRYTISIICISCCLLLPLTVEWVPSHDNPYHDLNYLSSSSFDSKNGTISSGGGPYADAANLHSNNHNNSTTPCRKSNSASTTTLSYYHFELHVLVFLITILSCSSFMNMYFYSKLVLMLAALAVYLVGFNLNNIYECLADSIEEQIRLSLLKAQIIIQMFFFIVFLHLIDRRVI